MKARTWMSARNDIPAPSSGGTSGTTSASRNARTRFVRGPAAETALAATRERSAPRRIHTAPPGSGMPPMSRNSSGSTKVSPMLA